MTENSIIPSFHFRVLFPGLKDGTDYDTRFESVAGVQGMTASTDTGRKAISWARWFCGELWQQSNHLACANGL